MIGYENVNTHMLKRKLGNTELLVSPIGLGTVKFGRNQGVKFPTPFELPNDAEIITLLNQAKELGINLIDTAPAYGSSEERLGKLLKNRLAWVICSKVGEEFIDGESYYDFTPEHAKFSIERSLQRLNTDFLDIVLVHSNGNDLEIIQKFGLLDALADLKSKGLLRAFGMSTKTIEGGKLALEQSDLAMVTFNPMHTEELPVIQHAHKLNKGIFIKKALMSGHIGHIQTIQNNKEENPIAYILKFIFEQSGISSVIIGTLNPKHLAEVVSIKKNIDHLI